MKELDNEWIPAGNYRTQLIKKAFLKSTQEKVFKWDAVCILITNCSKQKVFPELFNDGRNDEWIDEKLFSFIKNTDLRLTSSTGMDVVVSSDRKCILFKVGKYKTYQAVTQEQNSGNVP